MCDEIWIEVVYRYVHDVSHVISRWTVTHTKKKKHIDRYFTGNATRAFYIFSASVLGKVLHKDFLCALEASRNRSCKVGADSWGTKAEVLSKLSLKVTFCSHSWIRSTFISAFFSSFLDQVPKTTVGSPRDLWQTSSSVGRQTGLPYISLSTPELFICLLADTSWECKTDPENVKKRWHKTQARSEITAAICNNFTRV